MQLEGQLRLRPRIHRSSGDTRWQIGPESEPTLGQIQPLVLHWDRCPRGFSVPQGLEQPRLWQAGHRVPQIGQQEPGGRDFGTAAWEGRGITPTASGVSHALEWPAQPKADDPGIDPTGVSARVHRPGQAEAHRRRQGLGGHDLLTQPDTSPAPRCAITAVLAARLPLKRPRG